MVVYQRFNYSSFGMIDQNISNKLILILLFNYLFVRHSTPLNIGIVKLFLSYVFVQLAYLMFYTYTEYYYFIF